MNWNSNERKVFELNTASSEPAWLLGSFDIWRWSFFLIYALVAVMFYFGLVVPYLQLGDMGAPRLLADSLTYQEMCSLDSDWGEWDLLRNAGPCISLNLLGHSPGLVTLSNALLMVVTSLCMARSYGVSASKFLIVLLINPMTFLSIFGPNKEVFGIACVMSLMIFLQDRSLVSLLATLVFALLSRLPMLAVVLVFLLMLPVLELQRIGSRPWRFFWKVSMTLLFSLSAFSIVIGGKLSLELLGNVQDAADNSQSTIISLVMEDYSANGLYAVTYVVRLLLNLFGALVNIPFISIETHGLYYIFGVVGSSFMFLLLGLKSINRHWGNLLSINNSRLLIWIFCFFSTLIYCISPVIQHRYYFPLYPVLVLAALSWRMSDIVPGEPVKTE